MNEPLTLRQKLWNEGRVAATKVAEAPPEPALAVPEPLPPPPSAIDDAMEIAAACEDAEVIKSAWLQVVARLDAAAVRIDGLSGPYERARDALCAFLSEQARLATDDRVLRIARRRALAAEFDGNHVIDTPEALAEYLKKTGKPRALAEPLPGEPAP